MALNPITFTERVVEDFLSYQLTTYPLADEHLYAQLKQLLQLEDSHKTPLRQGPFVSLSRPFKQGATKQELITQGILHPLMESVIPYDSVRSHQEQAIRSVYEGKTTLVSTGTGSGKTESFLYPIISRCLELKDQNAPPGIVAVLIYPMNALAEDQLDRLRGLLAGRGISFGMYVGKTPEEEGQYGQRVPAGTTNLAYNQKIKALRDQGDTTTWLPDEELASRKSMRENPPRILLTNVKQLELLLTRRRDVEIFKGAPLEFLVFDEAHTFRGAQGAETACLIRRLRTFCGRGVNDVRHIATSATMADPKGGDDAPREFAHRFFGVDPDNVKIIYEAYDDISWNTYRSVPADPSEHIQEVLNQLLKAVDLPDDQVADAISAQLVELGGAKLNKSDWQNALKSQLSSNELVYQLADLLKTPQPLDHLAEQLSARVGRQVVEAEIIAWLALSAATGRGGYDPVLRPVVHSFIRGVNGAVVTFSAEHQGAQLWLSGRDAEEAGLGDLKRFPIISCTTCGQHYYENSVHDFKLKTNVKSGPEGGSLLGDVHYWEATADEGSNRVLLIDRLVVGLDQEDCDDEESEADGTHLVEHKRLHPMFVCNYCGSLHSKEHSSCGACTTSGALVPIYAVRTREDYPDLLTSCVSCKTPGRRPGGGKYREPARPIRAIGVSDVHILSQTMIHLSERRRLLVFADNRQDAAFQAGWMHDHARRFRFRSILAQQIPEQGGITVGDLVHDLKAHIDQDETLSRSLVPEVYAVVPNSDSVSKLATEMIYFLRLQVLREISTGIKQRLGLESWGRLRVEYEGLHQSLPFFDKWASALNVEPERLLEGVEAILDHHRRSSLLDDSTKIYGKKWNDGDKEIQYGYLPILTGGPKALKLKRSADNDKGRITQWVGERPTQVSRVINSWGANDTQMESLLKELWELLVELKLLVPVQLTSWKKTLSGTAGGHQVNASKLTLHRHQGHYRCQKCRRTTIRKGPTDVCMAWYCGGKLTWEDEPAEDFNLRVLDGDYPMLRVAEHSAQVPTVEREKIENTFKGEGEKLNTLVCTPTLELGVDIGSIDSVLMRNVPPTAANYWQRAGRAGRRHRMAVDITYAQATGFDQAYFREPLKLLGGLVEPPRFNLKNEEMIKKHVHATVLTTLYKLAISSSSLSSSIEGILARSFPQSLKSYLFDDQGKVLKEAHDVSELGVIIEAHLASILQDVKSSFHEVWPLEDAQAVQEERLIEIIKGMTSELQKVIKRFKKRLEWARKELRKLREIEDEQGALEPEDQAHERRCRRVIAKLKGISQRMKSSAQGGMDDSNTMAALATEGFLPGYGLESGMIIGTAEVPRMTDGLDDFELSRPVTMALREFVPGNAIYANKLRFVPRRFKLTPEETLTFKVSPENEVIKELGQSDGLAKLSAQSLHAIKVCDVIMPSQSQISDDEEFRFQMPVSTFAEDRNFHRGGRDFNWGSLELRQRRNLQLRLVNVGPRHEVDQSKFGFPLCLTCGHSMSPFSSKEALRKFGDRHQEHCGTEIQNVGFYADVEVEVFGLLNVQKKQEGYSFIEAIRMGAARILDMEIEDLQILAIGNSDNNSCQVILYDPMPGGSGLLDELIKRWEEVCDSALELMRGCPSDCETSCIDCLRTFRNRFYHESLNRHIAIQLLEACEGPLDFVKDLSANLPTPNGGGQPQTVLEARFRQLLIQAGLPEPKCQELISLGSFGQTIPDFFYNLNDEDEPGVCIYLDGMSEHIHGNPHQQEKDLMIREQLRNQDYEVIAIPSDQLYEKESMVKVMLKITKFLLDKEASKALKKDTTWYDSSK